MLEVNPITNGFVADIIGVDVKSLTDAEFEQIYSAWLEFGVLRLRGQALNEDELQRFSERFGPLEEAPFGKMSETAKADQKIATSHNFQISSSTASRLVVWVILRRVGIPT